MRTVDLLLYIVAVASFALAVSNVTSKHVNRINLIALGLLAWVLIPAVAYFNSY